MRTCTVIGFWYGNEPYAAGAILGRHDVGGACEELSSELFEGPWACFVDADDEAATIDKATTGMLELLP